MLRIFGRDVLPFLGKRSIHELRRPDLLTVLARIERRGALSISEQVRSHLNQIYRYALVVPASFTAQ
ncbi:MAG: hypothetical protein LBB76_05310 [Azoarcus sp.]|nr:hypothetical protein [Azoarcus sp.]